MCSDWWVSILGLCQFLCLCSLSILAVILNKLSNEKRKSKMVGKGKQIRLNTKDKKKEQEHFVRKPNQYFIIELTSNLTIGLFIL